MPKFTGHRSKKRKRMTDGKKALKLVRQMKKFIELKHYDTTIEGQANISDVGAVFELSEFAQGTTDITRIGDDALLTSFTMRGRIESIGTESASTVRFIVYIDKTGVNVTAPLSVVQQVTTVNAVGAAYNADFRAQFVVLTDRTLFVDQYNSVRPFHFFGRINKMIVFNNATATINKNSLKMLVISNASTGNGPTLYMYNRVFFRDG